MFTMLASTRWAQTVLLCWKRMSRELQTILKRNPILHRLTNSEIPICPLLGRLVPLVDKAPLPLRI